MNSYYYDQANSANNRLYDEYVNRITELFENKKLISVNDEFFSCNIPPQTNKHSYSKIIITDIYKN